MKYTEWYKKNRERISEKRKLRYLTDRKLRNARRQYSNAYYRKHHKVPVGMTVHKEKLYWKISYLAKRIDRSMTTIRRYHLKGIFPIPEVNERGCYLYTDAYVDAAQEALKIFDSRKRTDFIKIKEHIERRLSGKS